MTYNAGFLCCLCKILISHTPKFILPSYKLNKFIAKYKQSSLTYINNHKPPNYNQNWYRCQLILYHTLAYLFVIQPCVAYNAYITSPKTLSVEYPHLQQFSNLPYPPLSSTLNHIFDIQLYLFCPSIYIIGYWAAIAVCISIKFFRPPFHSRKQHTWAYQWAYQCPVFTDYLINIPASP